MKNFYKNLTTVEKTIFLEGFIGIIALLISIVGIVFGKPGFTIGIAIGIVVSIISSVLMELSTKWVLLQQKPALFLVGFFARMGLIAGAMVFTVLMQFVAKVEVFNFSVYGLFIGFAPSIFIVTIVQAKYGVQKGAVK